MSVLRCSIRIGSVIALVTRYVQDEGSFYEPRNETLTVVARSARLLPLEGAAGRHGLDIGQPLQLFTSNAPQSSGPTSPSSTAVTAQPVREPYEPSGVFYDACWDPFTACIFLIEGNAVVRLSGDNLVTLVAGGCMQGRQALWDRVEL